MPNERPPFDPVRAAFWLVAAVLGVQCIVVLAGVISCLVYAETIVKDPAIVCDPKDRLSALLAGALAAALALLAGFKGPPPPPPPPKE